LSGNWSDMMFRIVATVVVVGRNWLSFAFPLPVDTVGMIVVGAPPKSHFH
jgi:hypothetical protein